MTTKPPSCHELACAWLRGGRCGVHGDVPHGVGWGADPCDHYASAVKSLAVKFNEDEPRDDQGRWTDGGGGGDDYAGESEPAIAYHTDVGFSSPKDEARRDAVRESVNAAMSHMTSEFPRLEYMAIDEVKLVNARGTVDDHTSGDYQSGVVTLAADAPAASIPDRVRLGSGLASPSIAGTFRHEVGHHVDWHFLDEGEKAAWGALYNSKPKQWWSDNVSGYSAQQSNEAFAESFSVWAHPSYGKAGTKLPKEVAAYFKGVLPRRAKKAATLLELKAALLLESKAADPDLERLLALVDDFDWEAWAADLAPAYRKLYEAIVLEQGLSVYDQFDLDDPYTSKAMTGYVADRIEQLDETTREEVKDLIRAVLDEAGPSTTGELGDALAERFDGWEKWRADRVARSETGIAYNHGAAFGAKQAGLTHMRVLDGDGDEECRAANGQVWTIEDCLANPLEHPNCTRTFAPYAGDPADAGGPEEPSGDPAAIS